MAKRKYFPKDVEELVRWYQRYVSPLSLIAGFLSDNFILLKRVDLWRTNALLLFYLAVCGIGIVLINLIASGRVQNQKVVRRAPLIPVVVQFAFGGLFSGYLSLYSRSASLAVSWIFILLLAALLLGNERFMRLYERLTFQIALYFGAIFSFLIFYLPVLFKKIGPPMFLLSGGLSLVLIALFWLLLRRLVPELVKKNRRPLLISIASIYVAFNLGYFFNIIPPLPLSLKDAGVYHDVSRDAAGDYELSSEPLAWYQFYRSYNTQYHETPGEGAYVFTALFAPSGLSTTILHQWQYYDPELRKWTDYDTVRFAIIGGRDGGYRGYSRENGLSPGSWRVNVITQYGQLVGRVSFTIVDASTTPTLETIER